MRTNKKKIGVGGAEEEEGDLHLGGRKEHHRKFWGRGVGLHLGCGRCTKNKITKKKNNWKNLFRGGKG